MTNNTQEQWLLEDSGMDHYPDYAERESWKQKYGLALQAFQKGEACMDELLPAAEERCRAWFFRSAERLPLLHPRFPVYVSMLLQEEPIRNLFPAEIADQLVAKYGQRKKAKCIGIINGSYWAPSWQKAGPKTRQNAPGSPARPAG